MREEGVGGSVGGVHKNRDCSEVSEVPKGFNDDDVLPAIPPTIPTPEVGLRSPSQRQKTPCKAQSKPYQTADVVSEGFALQRNITHTS